MYNKTINICILFILILFLSNCDNNKNPVQYSESQNRIEISRNLPYLIVNDENSTIIFTGHDYESDSGNGNTDGEFDKIKFNRFDSNGDQIIDNKNILSSKAILKFAALKNEDQTILIVWLDPRNNPNFKANYLNTYDVDIYYKVIDFDGNTIKDDTRVTNTPVDDDSAYSKILLNDIFNGTLEDMKKKVIMTNTDNAELDSHIWEYVSPSYWILTNLKNNKQIFEIIGDHMSDSCYLLYSKINSRSKYIIYEKELVKYTKLSNVFWGPEIQNIYFENDSYNNTHTVWQLNPGNNLFEYYYLTLDNNGNVIFCNQLGYKYQ